MFLFNIIFRSDFSIELHQYTLFHDLAALAARVVSALFALKENTRPWVK